MPGAPEKSAQHAEMHEGVGPASGATTGVVAESLRCEGAEPGKMLGGKRQVATSRNASSARCAGRLAAAVRRAVGRVARAALPSRPRRVALIGLAFACSLTTPARALADTTPPTLGATTGGVTTYGSVIGKDINLYFSEPIDQNPDSLPAARPPDPTPRVDAFFITVDGVSFVVRPVSVRGGTAPNELVLGDLTSPIVRGQRVRVGYLDPTYGVDDAAAIQDLAGNDARTFDLMAIDNGVENTTGPRPIMKFVLATSGAGNTIESRWGLYPTSHGADSYDVQYAKWPGLPVPDSEWIDGPQGVSGTPGGHASAGEGTATIENLDYATVYWTRVRGTNSHGAGEWSGPVRAWTPLA